MIASWRGVAIAGVVAAVLAIAVAVDLGRARQTVDRALVPGFAAERVTELVWERAGQPAIRVARAGAAWQLRAPASAPADPGAISDVLAALRGARWHRRGDPVPVHATLTIGSATERRTLGLGDAIAGTDQRWIVEGARGLVVDAWVARALDRDVLALRIRAPLGDVRRADAIVVETAGSGLRLEGAPRRLVRPIALQLAPELADELERALAALAIVRLPAAPAAVGGLAITVAGAGAPAGTTTVEIGGSCPGAPELVAISGTTGDGCIDRLAATAIERAVARLRQSPEALVDRRPVPFEPRRVVLADGAALDVPALRIGDRAADPVRVTELLAALAAPAETAALPAAPAAQHMVVTDRTGASIALDLFAERVVARRGEPIALRPAPGAWSLLVRPARALRDLALWLEEPTMITAVVIDATSYERGAVIGEWTRRPSGTADARTLEALVAMLAAPRALAVTEDRFSVAHRVTIRIAPPAGPRKERVLELGQERGARARCLARVEQDAVVLPATICAYIASLTK